MQTKNFTGKTAIVSGASRGIGKAIALNLAAGGAQLVLTARSLEALADTIAQAQALGTKALAVATPDTAAEPVIAAALQAFGGVDILINNAGTTKTGKFTELTDADWADGYQVKVFGAVRLARAAWPHLKQRKGSVINIGGAGGHTPDARFSIGGSVNAAVMAFTKSLAQVGIEDGVQVNCINPGLVRTDRLIRRIEEAAEMWSVSQEEAAKRMHAELKITRFAESEEIADLVAYILSPSGRVFHGALLDADAGYTKGL